MQGKYFYIPGHHMIAYCHAVENSNLIIGGLSEYISDSQTNVSRQAISEEDFSSYNPIELDMNKLDDYPFLELFKFQYFAPSYRTKKGTHNSGWYLAKAKKIYPDVPSSNSGPMEFLNEFTGPRWGW